MGYQEIVAFWKKQDISTASKLSVALNTYSINFAYHSGKIENDNVTYYDTYEIFEKDRVTSYTGDLRTLYEIRNSKDAYNAILQAFDQRHPMTEEFVKEIQKQLTKETYDSACHQQGERPGEYKHHDYVTGRQEVGASPADTPAEMSELLNELQDVSDQNALTAAAYFHAKFENIHPFSDGNGRTGRLLMNYFLLLHNHPPVTIHEEDRKGYYQALEQFDTHLDLNPLKLYLMKQIEKTWQHTVKRNDRCAVRQTTLSDFDILSADTKQQSDIHNAQGAESNSCSFHDHSK